ncbi:SpvB/TcaC N-terminal domain-containing protein [Streptomyces sp. NPDC029674]|uniref:SpvB/TcaC N-terminal domain-containing protein n=1 Tax=Streptomyces sp. NPDC029674 TaxID=3365297 RepID=UPI00384CB5EF
MGGGAAAAAEGAVISLPQGGGAVSGLGETFAPDLFTGTGNFTVPIGIPPGRAGLTPQLSLGYSTGQGNGPFGIGWQLSLPGVARKTSRGVPSYADIPGNAADRRPGAVARPDVFVLSGADDLVPVEGGLPGRTRYRPRTEGQFARIEHVRDGSGDFWEVRGRDGMLSRYGSRRPGGADAAWRDPATVADPDAPQRIFGWRVTESRDALGNLIRYEYLRDKGREPGHAWDQPLLSRIRYADYGDRAAPSFLVEVAFAYEQRPDPFSGHRSGFEVRSTLRCRSIRVTTHAADGVARPAREYRLGYEQAVFNGVSLLTRVDAVGVDDQGLPPGQEAAEERLPPLTFAYTGFDPAAHRLAPLTGPGLPTASLGSPVLALVDLRGSGLPDVVELGPAAARVWRNAGGGRFELPRALAEVPPCSLADPGVRFLDANGDGRPDLLVSERAARGGPTGAGVRAEGMAAGYFPMSFAGGWSRRSFTRYGQSPSVELSDANVRLADLDGDGLTDVVRSGARLECWFNDPDPRLAWRRSASGAAAGPPVDFTNPRVRLADMTGDGLPDIVLLSSGNISYQPNLGHGRWGTRVTMRNSPRLPADYDARRLLLGDVDGDGAADLIFVDRGRVLLWGNRSGNGWTDEPVAVRGTPDVVGTDSVQVCDLYGTGMQGLLFSRTADGSGRPHLRFLDFSGGVKPRLLELMDNHLGAVTRVTYAPSTEEYLRDQRDPATRWRTTLPFPVHVVTSVEVTDALSGSRTSATYRYHHGYWDGVEREFRGFARVDRLDTETFTQASLPHEREEHFSPPTLTKSWFHPGPVAAAEASEWTEADLRHEYFGGDAPMLPRPPGQSAFLASLPRAARRSALRALRGRLQRTELYALDGAAHASRPYTVTESLPGIREESPPTGDDARERIFFPFTLGERVTEYERGVEPMTRFTFPAGHDRYGLPTGQLALAVPRGRDPLAAVATVTQPYLSTYTMLEYARRDDATHYLVDKVARKTESEVVHDGRLRVADLRDTVLAGPPQGSGVELRLLTDTRNRYDGDAYTGLPHGVLGEFGLLSRTESLAFTDAFLDSLYRSDDPAATGPRPAYLTPGGATAWTGEYPREFRDLLPRLAGHVHHTDGELPGSPAGYYVITARHQYDTQVAGRTPRGLPLASIDPLGAHSRIDYDAHDLLPVRCVDPAGLTTDAVADHRLLYPRELTDANGTTTTVAYSPAGFVTARSVRGRNGEGDRAAPGTRTTYDLLAFAEGRGPAAVRTVRRVHHDTDTDTPPERVDDVLVSVQYSDGFGRLLQTRTQAEDTLFGDPAYGGGTIPAGDLTPVGDTIGRTRGASDPENVIVSGHQVYDNKGRVVRKYEPFHATGFAYAEAPDARSGQHTELFYDPRGQVVRTLNPDGSEQRVLFGVPADLTDPDGFAPTPWESYTYDANDNAGRTHPDSTQPYASHWNTPASMEVDALGRTVRTVARNGAGPADRITTGAEYDVRGNLVSVTDALGRETFRYVYDMARRRWRADGIDCGRRDTVPDALGRAVETRDSKGSLTLCAFDALRRPTRVWARDDGTGPVSLRQIVEYGDGGTPGQPAAERAAARARNLLGRPVRHHDEAGLVTVTAADCKGNVLETTRRIIADAPILDSYENAAGRDWQIVPFQVEWTPAPGQSRETRDAQLLEPVGYVTNSAYDALDRVVRHAFPVDVEGRRRVLRPTYSRAGTLEQVRLDDTVYVQRISYDAKGQRTLIAYGNGVLTRYAYDPHTFLLTRLRSEHYTLVDARTYRPSGDPLQDHGYEHDLAGNLLTLRERTPGSGIPGNAAALGTDDPILRKLLGGGDALDRHFTYDPCYRLLSATGREHRAPPAGDPWHATPRGTDVTRAQAYRETYRYDAADSLLALTHTGTGGFARTFTLTPGSNRLRRTTTGQTPYDYTFDRNGNMTGETTSRHFAWDHGDRLKAFATRTAGAEPSVHAQYLHDATGRRIKKLVRRQGGGVEVVHYVDELFEHHRWAGSAGSGENQHIHVMDDRRRVALVRLGPAHPDDRGPATAFHLGDHLGSSTAVLDHAGILTNREEYTPYGETSFGGHTRKRYRFTGAERDEESGLNHHGARSYAPWTARWTSCDPLGIVDGLNLFTYVRANPLRLTDPTGKQSATVGDVASDAIGLLDSSENPFQVQGKAGLREIPVSLDIDEALPVGQRGISVGEARARALDVSNRQLLDPATNRYTKYLGTEARAGSLSRVVRSVAEDASLLFTHRFNEITEMRTVFADAVARVRDPMGMSPTALKAAVNGHVWDIIKTGTGPAATRVREALGKLGFENVPKTGFVMRGPPGGGAGPVPSGAAPARPSAGAGTAAKGAAAAEGVAAAEVAEKGAGLMGKAGRVVGFVGRAAIAVPVVYRSFMAGTHLREGHGWEAAKQVGLLLWEVSPGPLLLAGAEGRQQLVERIRATHDAKTAEQIIRNSCLYASPICRQ